MTTATTANPFTHHQIQIPGTNEVLLLPTRDSLRGADEYAKTMDWVRTHLADIKNTDRPQAATENLDMMLAFVLYNAAGAADMIAYIQHNVPALLGHAWLLDDYCARELGVEGVFKGYKYEIYEHGGIQFACALMMQLLTSHRLQRP